MKTNSKKREVLLLKWKTGANDQNAGTNFKKAIPIPLWCVIVLYFYSGACDCRTVSNLFDSGR